MNKRIKEFLNINANEIKKMMKNIQTQLIMIIMMTITMTITMIMNKRKNRGERFKISANKSFICTNFVK